MRLNWGTGIALVYGVFAACTVGFVAFAMSRPVQLVDDDYYASSLRHDERRAATENAAAIVPDAVVVDADGRGVTIVLPPRQVPDARGEARLYRPSDASADRRVPLALDAAGRQRLSLEGLTPGRWVVQLEWTSGGRTFYRETGVTAP